MKKIDFVNLVLGASIESATIISCADWMGGRQMKVIFNLPLEEVEENLPNYDYIEWHGDATDVVRNRNKVFTNTYDLFHGTLQEESVTLEELIIKALKEA